MRRSIYVKLALAFMLVALITAALMAVFIRAGSTDRLYRLVVDQRREVVQQVLADYYSQFGSWKGIELYWEQILRVSSFFDVRDPRDARDPGERLPRLPADQRNLFGLAGADGRWIIPIEADEVPGGQVARKYHGDSVPITVGGETVGTLLTVRQLSVYNPAEADFLARTNRALAISVLVALGAALLIGLLLAGTLSRPLRALTRAAEAVAAGDLEQQVDVATGDEIGQLAESFNRMSREVARSNQLRQQMTADVAHDLRTPLTVIGGYIEAMREGVLQPNPERLSLIYAEIERLQNLVGQLRLISQADAGDLRLNRQPADAGALLERAARTFQLRAEQQQIRLAVSAAGDLPPVLADEERMLQVLDNLIENALRYTPPGGEIHLAAAAAEGGVELRVRDSGSGIAAEDLPHVFERFRRGDVSRHSESGESGLGLAIVKAIVEAHGGRVRAESGDGQGTTIRMWLPASPAGA